MSYITTAKLLGLAAGVTGLLAGAAQADCPSSAPRTSWNVQAGDQRVSGSYVEKLVTGHKVRFDYGGYETYGANGSYSYKDSTGTYGADSVRFYGDGVRCIGYSNGARFDLYVVNGGKLVLINSEGERYVTRITN